jgi:NAD(P)H-hydrate epimerase
MTRQCEKLNISIKDNLPAVEDIQKNYHLIVDAIFGFSFAGEIRAPFDKILAAISSSRVPVASIDIPSGWDVEKGDIRNTGLNPEMLISLTAPKKCAEYFRGAHHYLGGRFVPPEIAAKFNLKLPAYPGSAQTVRLPSAVQGPNSNL